MKKTTYCLALMALGLACNAGAANLASVAASWLLIPTSTRQAALAGAFGALAEGTDALGVNPAGLGQLSGDQITILHNSWAQSLGLEHLCYGHGFGESRGAALGGDYLDFGKVDLYNLNSSDMPVPNGSISPTGMNLYGGFGMEAAKNFLVGVDAKVILQNLQNDNTSTVAGDLGLKYRIPQAGLAFGMALLNVGGTLDNANLPMALDVAGAYQTNPGEEHQLALAGDGNINLQVTELSTASVGMEYWYKGFLALRAGYRFAPYGNLTGLTGFSAGAGVKWGQAELAYALTTIGDLGMGNQLSLSFQFGPKIGEELDAPTGFLANPTEEGLSLSWNTVQEKGVMGYNLYVKKAGSQALIRITSKPLNQTTVNLKKLSSGADYIVGVTTVGEGGQESPMVQLTVKAHPVNEPPPKP